jgi:uncharacterized membrane protein
MSQNPLAANVAWQWIVSGWQTFLKSPVMWIVLSLTYVVSLFLLNTIPLIGALLAGLLTPALLAGMLHGVKEVESGRELKPLYIFQAFQDQAKLIQLVLLGLVTFTLTLLQKGAIASDLPQALAVLAGLLLSLASACALLYGLPLVMLANEPAAKAIPKSLRACLGQALAVGVFLSLALLLLVLALLPLGIGLLVYLPVMTGAMYASYKQVI